MPIFHHFTTWCWGSDRSLVCKKLITLFVPFTIFWRYYATQRGGQMTKPPPSDGYLRWSRFKKSAWWESAVFRNNDELTRMVHLGYQHVLLSFPNIKVLAIQVYAKDLKISAYSLIGGGGGGSLYSHVISPITGHHESGTNLDRQN